MLAVTAKRPRRRDPVAVIEAAYRIELPEMEWLQGIAAAALPLLDDGFGINAYLYERRADGTVSLWSPVLVGADPDLFAALAAITLEEPTSLTRLHSGPPCSSVSRELGAQALRSGTFERSVAHFGVRDVLGVLGGDPTGFGCGITAPRRRRGPMAAGTVTRWEHVAAHLASACRLRRATSAEGALAPGFEAVLEPSGSIVDAVGSAQSREARDALRDAAAALDRARGALRREAPDGAVELWKGLVAGRWSLVDHFDTDGRRLLVARRNEVDPPRPAGVSSRGRQILAYRGLGHSLKLIAYELGLSTATVSEELGRAMRTLGLRSEAELASLVARREDDSGERDES
jgi:DNA-binding CsgD family transcriptional regulator